MIGKTVSHYRILEKLGGGGMGVVYRGEDTKLERTVALKFLPPELTRDERAKQRFIIEAQAASRLDHPNICTIYEIEETEDGQLFIAMACYEGETARARLAKGPMPIDEAAGLAVHVARGLEKAHEKGIVHRDVKPANIFITNEGRAKILDFGLAKLAGQTKLTQAGSTVGTVAYMSPEQAQGRDVTEQSDIWSLGVLLYEALTGVLPFRGERPESLLYEVVHEDPTPVSELRQDVPPELAEVVMRCLEKDPSRRLRSAGDVATAVMPFVSGSSTEATPIAAGDTVRVPVLARRRARAVPIVAAVALACAVLLLALPQGRSMMRGWLSRNDLPERRRVAVLPLLNVGGDDSSADLAEGLRCYITSRLTSVERFEPALRMVPATEVSDRSLNTASRARDLSGASLAIAGSVMREGEEVRVDLELVDAASQRTVRSWSGRDHVANVAALQSDLVSGALRMLGIAPDEEEEEVLRAGGTTVPGAFVPFVEALGLLNSAKRDSAAQLLRAVELLTESVTADPAYALAHVRLGDALRKSALASGDSLAARAAEEYLDGAIAMGPKLPSAHVALGLILAGRGDHEAAYAEFRRATELDPMHTPALDRMAETATVAGDLELAELSYTRVTELRPESWHAHYSRGVFYYYRGRYEEALDALEAASALAPGNSYPYSVLGAAYYHMDRLDDAWRMMERSVEVEPSREGYNNLGTFHFADARYADAIRMYEKALEIDDSHYGTWGNLAAACKLTDEGDERAAGYYGKAVEMAEAQLRIKPHDAALLTHLASYYTELGQAEQAKELVERALTLDPENDKVMFQAGHTYEVLGDREAALEWILRAVECGYSRAQVESTPALRELCTDERYRSLVRRGSDES